MAMVPSGGGDEGAGGGRWTDAGDGLNGSAAAPQEPGSWSVGGPDHPTFCLFKRTGCQAGSWGPCLDSVIRRRAALEFQFSSLFWITGVCATAFSLFGLPILGSF
jgi:hypothetical protein